MTADLLAILDQLDEARAKATPGEWEAGPVELPPTFPVDLFWSRVNKTDSDSCWLWTGRTTNGYGRFEHRRRTYAAHRLAWLLTKGGIDPRLTMDHLCRVPGCVNPDHLEQVSMRENVLRSTNPTAKNAEKTHCVRSHELTPANVRMERGRRRCRECRKASGPTHLRKPCPHCGDVMRSDSISMHIQRKHPITDALTPEATS